jgi:uncharacterized 2Fe-2S/4Fe-4S cluster protein (DUF4445 family)
MAEHKITFDVSPRTVSVPTGTLLMEAAQLAGVDIAQPCGGQGRCGRCAVQITKNGIRRRSTLRLSSEDVERGFALACQSVVEGDTEVIVPPQEKIERRLTTDRTVAEVAAPAGYDPVSHQVVHRFCLNLPEPSMDDQTDDWSRLQTGIRQQAELSDLQISLPLLRQVGPILRQGNWQVTAVVDMGDSGRAPRLIALQPGHMLPDNPLWGAAIDIGTTTVTVWLVDLNTGQIHTQTAEYNRQINRGEDVISRIIYASKNGGDEELRSLVLESINQLVSRACQRAKIEPDEIMKATVVGNSTMMHLLLGIPAASIRLSPFVTAVNQVPVIRAREVGLVINPEASVDCLPGVASYVGADISAGVLSSGLDDSEEVCLFMDIGTNGEIVLGSRDWLVTCACSAGPAFEGAGVMNGMRATRGAIEEVWISSQNYEPSFRVIGGGEPRGLCGSGLLSLLAELFLNGVLDKGGNFNTSLKTDRIRQGDHGLEYVLVWGKERGSGDGSTGSNSSTGDDIVITHVDVDNLLRAKAAIYAGYTVLAESVGFPLEAVDRVLIGGSFGKYINVEKAVEIGLLPDMSWDRFQFLGNTAVRGAYLALLQRDSRARIGDIAGRLTYIELSADNSFYDAFTSALFLPHTDMSRFPTVASTLQADDTTIETKQVEV